MTKIIVIEDEVVLGKIYRDNLIRAGYESMTADSIEAAVKLAERFSLNKELVKSTTSNEKKQIAPRPISTCLDSTKLEKIISYNFKNIDQGIDEILVEQFGLTVPPADLSEWEAVVAARQRQDVEVTVALVGKYVDLRDSYKSLAEALVHAGLQTQTKVKIRYVESGQVESGELECLSDVDAIVVPGGFGDRGVEGKINTVRYARENRIPYLGICLGMQAAVIEYARNVAGMDGAHSTEFDPAAVHPVIALITEWRDLDGSSQERDSASDLGGTMRLGAQECKLSHGSLMARMYGSEDIHERHRHRFEFNNHYREQLSDAGLVFSGVSVDDLVEAIEIPGHPWFVAVQFHPEFTSNPRDGHPLFTGFISAARQFATDELAVAADA